MTFELLEKIIIEEQIPKDVELLADTENDLGIKIENYGSNFAK